LYDTVSSVLNLQKNVSDFVVEYFREFEAILKKALTRVGGEEEMFYENPRVRKSRVKNKKK
jgi:hypothetical protein